MIVLFRRDLRIADNLALAAAAGSGRPVVPVFVLDEETPGLRPPGGAARWWLHHSLAALERDLRRLGAGLVMRRGAARAVVEELVGETGAASVLWNRRYEPGAAAADAAMKAGLRERGIRAESFDGALLHEPSLLKTGSGGFYKVFTPFWNAMTAGPGPRDAADPPARLAPFGGAVASPGVDWIAPLPDKPDWAAGLRESWVPGEAGARRRLESFLAEGLGSYAARRDLPGAGATSRLSPHLAFGEITPFQIFAALEGRHGEGAAKFRKEIGWREFCHHLLFNRPGFDRENFQEAFDAFPWRDDEKALTAWQRGMTGYPVVDAGMRELWRTGTMHNRVRMIAASFLTKHLLIDWRAGESWFWDTLVDADPASNPGNWQWVAGSGADAAPFFRIFNPVLQGRKFDPDGTYVRRWVPELAGLPARYVHAPWTAPATVLADCGIRLGRTYPAPIIDHDAARQRALAAWRGIRGAA